MSFNRSTHLEPNIISKMDDSGRLVKSRSAPNGSFLHMGCALGDLQSKGKTMDARMLALGDLDGNIANKMDEDDICNEDEEPELKCERGQALEYPNQEFLTRLEVQALLIEEAKTSSATSMRLVDRSSGRYDNRRTTSPI